MNRFEVVIRDKTTGNNWSLHVFAETFALAEQAALTNLQENSTLVYDEIIRIDKEYERR